jgi:hypothetical protein
MLATGEQLILEQFYNSQDEYVNGGMHGQKGRFNLAFRITSISRTVRSAIAIMVC